ncbi:MAG TPA: lamin tail domain-containing protein, partial [Cyclobacteriaceae bacterium]|nr:lamin tail domain-containing protein [Cyclobacteriaceae bacterium]
SIGGQGSPMTVTPQPDGQTIILKLRESLNNGAASALTVSGIKDLAGNIMKALSTSILYFKASPIYNKDVIITEMFPDPSPQVGLPAAEFVEILNRSANPINLSGWKLSDGSSIGVLPSQIIMPGEYWILTAAASVSLYSAMGKTIGLPNFPTLNNSSDTLTLKNAEGLLLDSVNYNTSWYRDEDKMDGGWTLELIDPQNVCAEETNWTSSENTSGGTPGKQNSVFASKPDLTAPRIVSVFPDTQSDIRISFNEKLDPASLDINNFVFAPPREISGCRFMDRARRDLVVRTTTQLEIGTAFSLNVSNVTDCSHNVIDPSSVIFGIPEAVDSLDVVVNEILFNPRSGGVDFIEVMNRSSKYLNLKGWKLGNYDGKTLVNGKEIFSQDHLIAPKAFAVFTSDPPAVLSQYSSNDEKSIFASPMPSLPDDEGSVAITDEHGKLIDAVAYSQKWQSQFINDDEGVSLERIDAAGLSNDPNNWTSASSVSGFATPGISNSQRRAIESSLASVTVVPEVFTPGAGPAPFVQIIYTDAFHGAVANVRVYDREGHLQKTIVNNEILGAGNFLRWDGDRDDGMPAKMGYYFVWFEVFDSSGTVMTIRKRVIVTAQD